MSNKIKRLLLIVLMLAILVYTVINYTRGNLDQGYMLLTSVMMVWILVSQVGALIREWREE